MNILYVEDNKVNAVVMDKMLSKNSLKVIIAENALRALEMVNEHELDLILVDINLGINQMDGCELLQRFQQINNLQAIPKYAVTAYAMPGDKKKFINLGFDNYFSKPVDFKKLQKAIDKVESRLKESHSVRTTKEKIN